MDIIKCCKARTLECWLLGTYFKLGTKAHIGHVTLNSQSTQKTALTVTVVWTPLFPQMQSSPQFKASWVLTEHCK